MAKNEKEAVEKTPDATPESKKTLTWAERMAAKRPKK